MNHSGKANTSFTRSCGPYRERGAVFYGKRTLAPYSLLV